MTATLAGTPPIGRFCWRALSWLLPVAVFVRQGPAPQRQFKNRQGEIPSHGCHQRTQAVTPLQRWGAGKVETGWAAFMPCLARGAAATAAVFALLLPMLSCAQWVG